MKALRDEFLSEEDLDLDSLSEEELDRRWTEWLKQAQATNDRDRKLYSHGVFVREPPWDDLPVRSRRTGVTESKEE